MTSQWSEAENAGGWSRDVRRKEEVNTIYLGIKKNMEAKLPTYE